MNKLGDNDEQGLNSLGGFRLAGFSLRQSSVRRGSVLYDRRGEFSVINRAAVDLESRSSVSVSRPPGYRQLER